MWKKKLAALMMAALLLAGAMLSGCSLVEVDPESDLNSVVAVVYGQRITKREVMNVWNRQKASMGVSDAYEQSKDGQRIIGSVLQNLLQDMVHGVVRREQARNLGLYPLTDEMYARVLEIADETYEERLRTAEQSLIDSYTTTGFGEDAEADLSDAAQRSVQITMENQFEFSREMDLREAENQVIIELLRDYYGQGITADESQIQEHYDELLETQKESYSEDTNNFIKALKEGNLIVYQPGHVVRVKNLLVGFDEETQAKISSLRNEGKNSDANALLEESAKAIRSDAEAILEEAKTAVNFDDMIVRYGTDTGMMLQDQRDEGYLVGRDSTDFEYAFKEGCMQLTQAGQISDLVLTDYGYHIIYVMEVFDEKTFTMDEVHDAVADDLLETERGVVYVRAMEELYDAAPVEYYYKRLLRGNLSTLGYDNELMLEEIRFPDAA